MQTYIDYVDDHFDLNIRCKVDVQCTLHVFVVSILSRRVSSDLCTCSVLQTNIFVIMSYFYTNMVLNKNNSWHTSAISSCVDFR